MTTVIMYLLEAELQQRRTAATHFCGEGVADGVGMVPLQAMISELQDEASGRVREAPRQTFAVRQFAFGAGKVQRLPCADAGFARRAIGPGAVWRTGV
eukprot:4245595-Pyramimonas_sp.AAC.1